MAAEHSTLAVKLHPRIRFSRRPSAYIEIPDENTVMTANASAFSARVFSSKRSLRYSGTLRARLAQYNGIMKSPTKIIGTQHAGRETPPQNQVQQKAQRVHRNPRREYRHDGIL